MDAELEPGWEEAFLEMEALFTEMGLWELLNVAE
jgi:hypothetical protein